MRGGPAGSQKAGICNVGNPEVKNINEYDFKYENATQEQPEGESQNDDCDVPDWAKKIGHEEVWKEYYGCE